MSDRLAELMRGFENKYPAKLAESFPRISNHIAELWDRPEELNACFQELLISDRPGRQGFPHDVASEIFSLSMAYDAIRAAKPKETDVWAVVHEQATLELEKLGIKFTSRNFFQSLAGRDNATVVLFLNAGIDVDIRDEREWTALMVASFDGNEDIALTLVEHGANVGARDGGGYTPLHWAAFNGYLKVVHLLLGKRANPNEPSRYGLTPVLQAAAKGHVEVVKRLIAAGASVNAATLDGWTPLHKAVANHHAEVVDILVMNGADPAARHRDGETPLSIARQGRQPHMVDLLLKPKMNAARTK